MHIIFNLFLFFIYPHPSLHLTLSFLYFLPGLAFFTTVRRFFGYLVICVLCNFFFPHPILHFPSFGCFPRFTPFIADLFSLTFTTPTIHALLLYALTLPTRRIYSHVITHKYCTFSLDSVHAFMFPFFIVLPYDVEMLILAL